MSPRPGDPRPGRRYRYGAWRGGPDPLASPLDVRSAVDAIGEDVMAGSSVRDALRRLLRGGLDGASRGLDRLRAEAARRRREVARRGRADGALTRAGALLDQALAAEREALAGRDGDDARFAEARLDALPRSTARAVQELDDYDWASPEARQAYQRILDELQREILDHQFGDLSSALRRMAGQATDGSGEAGQAGGAAAASEATRQLLADLNELLDAHARGEDTTERFEQFMDRWGEVFESNPRDVDELLDELARRAAAAQAMLDSLSPAQRDELAQLTAAALGRDPDLAAAMAGLSDRLAALRPGATGPRSSLTGSEPLGYGEAAGALGELADLDDLVDALGQQRAGSTLDDVDVDQVERTLGRGAADDVVRLRELERELHRQGWLSGTAMGEEDLRLSPKAMRRLGESALRAVTERLRGGRRGQHEDRDPGSGSEPTGSWREWRFGDEQPLDVVRTVTNAVLREAGQSGTGADLARDPAEGRAEGRAGGPARRPTRRQARHPVRLDVRDMAVVETEQRSRAAVALCVDLSFSMVSEGRWGPMKQTALALGHLVATRFPADALQVVGFGRYARPMTVSELAHVEPDYVQGTNLAHALALARAHVASQPGATPVVLVVTDGEPTAHLVTFDDGETEAWFDYPPAPETIEATVREVDALTRMRVPIDIVVLGDDPGLARFVDGIARRNGGRVLSADPDRLGGAVVADYLRARRG